MKHDRFLSPGSRAGGLQRGCPLPPRERRVAVLSGAKLKFVEDAGGVGSPADWPGGRLEVSVGLRGTQGDSFWGRTRMQEVRYPDF